MKKKAMVLFAAVFLAANLSACENNTENSNDTHSIINYTNTGDNVSSHNSKTADIEHVSSESESKNESKNTVTSNESDISGIISSGSDSAASKDKNSSKASSSEQPVSSAVQQPPRIVTYYYYNVDTPPEEQVSEPQGEVESQPTESDSDTQSEVSSQKEPIESEVTSEKEPEPTVSDPDTDIDEGEYSQSDIALFINNEKIYLGDKIDDALKIMGEPNSIEDISPGSGSDTERKMYNYDGYWVTAEKSEDSDEFTVYSAQIFYDTIETEKGVKIGMSLSDVIKIYGNGSSVVNDEHRYYCENKYMYFYIQNDIVADIGYRIDPNVDNTGE